MGKRITLSWKSHAHRWIEGEKIKIYKTHSTVLTVKANVVLNMPLEPKLLGELLR